MEIFCDKCGTKLREDNLLTIRGYDVEFNELVDASGDFIISKSMDYVYYSCTKCSFFKKVLFDDVIKDLKLKMIESIVNTRYNAVVLDLKGIDFDESNGISYCGICPGTLDDTGYCYNDVISKCRLRRIKLGD